MARRASLAASLASAALLVGCDQGTPHDQPTGAEAAPALHVVGANVAPDLPLPADGEIRIAFDRLLLPLSAVRQSIVIYDAFGNVASSPLVVYDPVTRVVTLANPSPGGGAWLTPGTPYKVRLGVPDGDSDIGGFRAIDRATLAAPSVIGFVVADAAGPPKTERAIDFCADVYPLFTQRCGGGACHGAPEAGTQPAAGLVLTSAAGIVETALGRVANGANTGPRSGAGLPPQHLFGVDMPIIDPGDPANSWLLYKVLLAEPRADDGDAGDCGAPRPPVYGVPLPSSTPLSDDERTRLGARVLGRPMPYPSPTSSTPPLTYEELERVRAWIQQGARTTDTCAACATGITAVSP